MEKTLCVYEQHTVDKFDQDIHYDRQKNLHYGFIETFEDGVNHANFPPCSVQQGLKSGQNVFLDDKNKRLIITKDCTHWIDIMPKDTENDNSEALNKLIDSINYLNNVTGNNAYRFDTIHIYIDPVVASTIHRWSTFYFTRHLTIRFFRRLDNIKNISYLTNDVYKTSLCRLFVSQDIIEKEGKEYFFPLILINPAKEYSVLVNGVIGPRKREDKTQVDSIFFTESNGQYRVERYTVTVHPDICMQEIIQEGSICNDNINRNIGNLPTFNRMKEYPLDILRALANQYSINIKLLMSPKQLEDSIKEAKARRCLEDYTYTHEYNGNISLEQCLNREYAVGIQNNILELSNSSIDCIKWIEQKDDNLKNAYDAIAKKLYFLCWVRNIHTVEIQVPTSKPSTVIDEHSLAVLTRDSMAIFNGLSSIVKQVKYVPYNPYQKHKPVGIVLYIHPNVYVKNGNQQNVSIEENVLQQKLVLNQNRISSQAPYRNTRRKNIDNDRSNKKNGFSILSSLIFKAICVNVLLYIAIKCRAYMFFIDILK